MTSMDRAKPFCIAKRDVWEAYKQVKANRGAAGVDGQSIEDFDRDLNKHLYRIWNRMCSGSYFPPPVRRVDIPKGESGGTRPLGIPTVADRIAQMVVKRYLDIKSFFDEIDWGLLMQAVRRHTDCKWVLLYLQRWLEAPVSMPKGTLVERTRGTPQGAVVSPVLANLFLHYVFDLWMRREHPGVPFERYADDAICHCRSEAQALELRQALERGLRTANYNCIRKRPRSCIARMQIAPGNTRSSRSTFSAIHSGQDWRATTTENASSHLSQRSVKRLARGCGSAYAVGECIVEATLNWRRSPPGFARS
jgi:hypothetical protein